MRVFAQNGMRGFAYQQNSNRTFLICILATCHFRCTCISQSVIEQSIIYTYVERLSRLRKDRGCLAV